MNKFTRKLASFAVAGASLGLGYFGYNRLLDSRFAYAEEQREQTRQSVAKLEDLSSVFKAVGKIVEPSVVSINVHKKVVSPHPRNFWKKIIPDRNGDNKPDHPLLPELPEMPDVPDEVPFDDGSNFDTIGTGSGVIIEAANGKGYILTNNHVAGGASEIAITFSDGREINKSKVKLLGADPRTDLAVLEIMADRLSPAKWGNSDEAQKGDWILAFGSPFGYVGSMTHGIISALNRQAGILGMNGYENFIQVDAPINPGNSGGPLVNLRGEVIGINTAIASQSGGFQGIGFAIPSNQARYVYQSLKEKGKVTRGWIGVGITDVSKNQALAESFGYTKPTGVLVNQIIANTPANGKLQKGDIVTAVNGKTVETVQQFRSVVAGMPPGTEIKLSVFRGGKDTEATIKLGEQPDDLASARPAREGPAEATAPDNLGLRVKTLTPELARQYGVDVKAGVVITSVERNSPAAKEMLAAGNVITQVGDTEVKTVEDFDAAMKKQDLKKGVRLYVETREGGRFALISPEK